MISINGVAGTDYYLRVGGFSSNTGTSDVLVFEVPPPGPGPIGSTPSLCNPGNPNSTGLGAEISAFGELSVADQDVRLSVDNVPDGRFGIFFGSRTLTFVPLPGNSSGNLCVAGNIGRYFAASQIFMGAGAGSPVPAGGLQVGDIPVPTNPLPGEPILAGDTWYWQAWYRDVNDTNNFSNVVRITFLP
jgi:hypothetical protein